MTVGGSSTLTGAACTPNLVHWTYDSWNLAHSTTTALVKTGGNAWYFVAPDYAYGKAVVADATKFVLQAGGRVTGASFFPFPDTTDFSAYAVRAQSSGANVVAFAAGGTDLVNFVKQCHEFGVAETARIAAMTGFVTDVLGVGVPIAQGMMITENFTGTSMTAAAPGLPGCGRICRLRWFRIRWMQATMPARCTT